MQPVCQRELKMRGLKRLTKALMDLVSDGKLQQYL